jgi:hypothetical protein
MKVDLFPLVLVGVIRAQSHLDPLALVDFQLQLSDLPF